MTDGIFKSVEIKVPAGEESISFQFTSLIYIQKSDLETFKVRVDNNSYSLCYEGWNLIAKDAVNSFLVDNTDNTEELNITVLFSKFIFQGSQVEKRASQMNRRVNDGNLTISANRLIVPRNPERKYFEITNDSPTAGEKMVLNDSVTFEDGTKIEPVGGQYTGTYTGEVWAHSLAGSIGTNQYVVVEFI